jgi:hypothetical protein
MLDSKDLQATKRNQHNTNEEIYEVEEDDNDNDNDNEDDDEINDEDRPSVIRNFLFSFVALIKMFRRILGLGCFSIIIIAIILLYTIIFKPQSLWNPLKNFLNNYEKLEIQQEELDGIYKYINTQLINSDNIVLTERQLAKLIQHKTNYEKEIVTKIDQEKIIVYLNIDEKELPLWWQIVLGLENNELKIVDSGLIKVGIPQSLVSNLNDKLSPLLNIIGKNKVQNIMQDILEKDKLTSKYEVRKIELTDAGMIVYFYD